ncbi:MULTISPECIES: adenylate/guanylate cyclase domain-containing protein [unclassified Synechococcus]|uniref:adenylate/guanylate cyclase domain-containing protein n=1 Tax=unclassified Synechococcus TaxID=2626047 RepID=UPI002570BBA8|nr:MULTISPECIES: adenylate/guanylate cyclase domain-containing protein [unclassified Synechococcus]
MARRRTFRVLVVAVLAWVGVSSGWPGPRMRVWERGVEQQLLLLRGPRRPPPKVVLVTVDDATLQQGDWFEEEGKIPDWAKGVGSLPWPRATYGMVAEKLLQAGARAVAVNVVFEGPSGKGPADDDALELRLRRYPGRVALAAEMLESSDTQGAGALTFVRPERFLAAIGGTGSLGLTNILAGTSSEPSRHPEAYASGVLPARGAEGHSALSSTLLRLGGQRSRQDDRASALNFYGPEGSFQRLPAWEVLDPARWQTHPLRKDVKGALVLLGPVVAQGTDGYPTPFGPLSGLEVLATATANSLQGDGLQPWPRSAPGRALLALVPLLLVLGAARRWTDLRWRLALVVLVLVLQGALVAVALQQAHRWLPLLAPSSGLVLLGLLYGGDAYLREGQERRRLRRTFERYVAPGVVAEILSDPESAQGILRGRLLEVTVLMTDIKGFTVLTKQRSGEGQSELHVLQLNEYLGAMVEVVMAHGGTVDKFIGDAVMAVFGSPVSRGVAEEASQAVRCALAMRAALAGLNEDWARRGIATLDNGIGLASGQVMVGQIGSPKRMEFTVIGDTVNLSARLESATRNVDAAVVCDAQTASLIAADPGLAARSLGPQAVKSLGEVEIFTVALADQVVAGDQASR